MEQTSPKIPEKKLFYSGTKQKRGRVRRNRRQMTIHPLRHTESRPPTDESAVGSPGETSCCSRGWYRHRKGQFDVSASSKCSERIRVDGNWALNAHADAIAKAANIEREAIADPDAGLFTEMSHRLRPACANRDGGDLRNDPRVELRRHCRARSLSCSVGTESAGETRIGGEAASGD